MTGQIKRFSIVLIILLNTVIQHAPLLASQTKAGNKAIHWPPAPAKTRYTFVRSVYGEPQEKDGGFFAGLADFLFGEQKPQFFIRPHDIAVSESGEMAVTDPGAAGVHIIGPDGSYEFIQYVDDTRLQYPLGISYTANGDILLTDVASGTLFRMSPDGDELARVQDKTWQRPTDIAIHPQTQDIYVLDTAGHQVHVYDSNLKKKYRFGKRGSRAGEFNFPTHLAFSASGELYVTDSMNFRIQIFDSKNHPKAQFGKLGDRLGEFSKPKGIAIDKDGNVYVIDAAFDHLLIYDSNGRFLLPIGGMGDGPGQFNLPNGIAVSNHTIYIVDSYNRRVQILRRAK